MATTTKSIIERVKSFEGACKIAGVNPKATKFTRGTADTVAYQKLKLIISVLNEGWKPDWNNRDQYKYAPWFWLNDPGFRFDGTFCVYTFTLAAGGSRLCFKTRELAEYAAKKFLPIYKQFLL